MRTMLVLLLLAGASAAQDLAAARALVQQGDLPGAVSVLREHLADHDDDGAAWMLLGGVLHAQGDLEDAIDAHARAAAFPALAASASYNVACAHALRGETEAALDWLGRAREAGFADRGLLLGDADLAAVRADPRFAALLPPLLSGDDLFVEEARVLYVLDGEAAGDQFGWVARDVGDLDGDGVRDFAATAPTHGAGGRVTVHSGRDGALLFARDGEAGARLGNSVAGRFDADADGVPDVVVGAPGAGRALVLSGADGAPLLALASGESGDQFGMKVTGLEDLDGDGHDEVAVGAPSAGPGRVHVFSGSDGAPLFTLSGGADGDGFGSAVDGTVAGGHRLLAVGAMRAGGTGRAHVFRCAADGATPHFTIEPDATSRNLGQYFVAILGDTDGDEVPDVFASDWNNAALGPNTGRVYVHSGATGERLLTLTGSTPGEGFGTSQSVAGDVDGDGAADLIVGSWQHAGAAPSGGRCALYSGADGALLRTWTCRQAGDTFGFDAVGLGDVDGDGATDFLLTSAWSAVKGPQTGRVLVVAGDAAGPRER